MTSVRLSPEVAGSSARLLPIAPCRPLDFNALDFAAVDEQGQTYDATVILLNRPNLGSGAMPAGEMRSGWIGFEVPNGTGTVTITWDDAYTLSPPAEIARYTVS